MRLLPLTILCAFAYCTAFAQTTPAVDGSWVFYMTGDPTPQRVQLTTERDSVRGRVYGQSFAGAFRQNTLRFSVGNYRWDAKLNADQLEGWIDAGSLP